MTRDSDARGPVFLPALALALAATGLIAAQQPAGPGPLEPKKPPGEDAPYALRVDVPVVTVDVTVTDKNGSLIPNLRREHFHVFQDGEEQQITSFAPTHAPLTAVLVVEVNRGLSYLLYNNLDAAYFFLNQLTKEDWVALVSFSLKPRVEVDFTHDRRSIVRGLQTLQFGNFSESNLYDAVVDTLERLQEVEQKKSIILVSTGRDSFSKLTWDGLVKKVRGNTNTTIFSIGMGWELMLLADRASFGPRGIDTSSFRLELQMGAAQLRELAEMTGGSYYEIRFITQLPDIYREIGERLRNQYTLAYQPRRFQRDGKFHKIEVKLLGPDGQPVKVMDQNGKQVKYEIHARKGFQAPKA